MNRRSILGVLFSVLGGGFFSPTSKKPVVVNGVKIGYWLSHHWSILTTRHQLVPGAFISYIAVESGIVYVYKSFPKSFYEKLFYGPMCIIIKRYNYDNDSKYDMVEYFNIDQSLEA